MKNRFRVHVYLFIAVLFLSFVFIGGQKAHCATTKWDVIEIFGVDTIDASPGTIHALDSARAFFDKNPNDTLILYYPSGEYNFFADEPTISFGNSFSAGTNGRLVIEGAGYESTVFITKNRKEHSIHGKNVYRVLFKGIHFTRDYCTVPQGTVVSVSPGEVILELHEGFPTPDSLMAIGRQNDHGLWLRKYTDDLDDPHIIPENNDQIAWDTSATSGHIEGRLWKFELKNSSLIAPYQPGDIIGVKLKHGGQTFWVSGGDDIDFINCKWTRKTRGVLRGGIGNVDIIDCHFDRGPKVGGRTPVMASPGGGPQVGQPWDETIYNVVVEDCIFISSGDDNVGLFRINGLTVRNSIFTDAFARGILLNQITNACIENNVLERCPILWHDGDGFSKCNWDYDPPSEVTGLAVTDTGINNVTIVWNPATDNRGVESYYVYLANNLIEVSTDTTATITSLHPGTFYVFRVFAVDSTGNESQVVNVTVTTKEDTTSSIGIGDDKMKLNASIFPNPANVILKIIIFDDSEIANINIADLSGRVHFMQTIAKNESNLDISNLKSGIYIAEISTEEKVYQQQLIIL